jgi:putative ABC transport system substrate-binding protein
MRRRNLLCLLAGAMLTMPLEAVGQQPKKPARIGVLVVGGPTAGMTGPEPSNPYVKSLLAGLAERGLAFGRDFVTEPRGGEGMAERYASLVAEVVAAKPDVIVAAGPMLAHLKQATSTIPVVMSASDDPIIQGYSTSLSHPSANFTGLSWQSVDIADKRLELLRELVPGAGPVAVLWDQESRASWLAAEAAGKTRGWQLLSLEVRDAGELEAAFAKAVAARADGLMVFAAAHLFAHQNRVVELAARNRLPTMYQLRPYVEAGGLVVDSASLIEGWHRAAYFVDRLLRGAMPADLPIEQPVKFELVVNLKTAGALGLTVPPTIMLRATEVIE